MAPTPTMQSETEAAPPTQGTAPADRLTLSFRGDSWVEVHDATGERLMYRLGRSGETRTVTGQAPFQVLLGNAPDVDVKIDGKEFDVSAHTRGKVARFKVGG